MPYRNPSRETVNPSQLAVSYELQAGCPATQTCPAGVVNCEVCPISQTNELGVSSTSPHPSALPIFWLLNRGSRGQYLLFRTIVPEWPVVTSVTVTFQPWPAAPRWKWIRTVSPAFMTRGDLLVPS